MFSRPRPKQYLKFSIGTMAGAGVVLGVMVFLLEAVGGFSIVPSSILEAQSQAQGGMASAGLTTGMDYANGLTLTYLTAELVPFLAVALALGIVALIVTRMNDTPQNKMMTAAAGVAVGGFLFVVLSTIIASIAGPTIPGALLGTAGGLGASGAAGVSQSLNFGPLVLDALVVGIACGMIGGLVTYLGDSLPN